MESQRSFILIALIFVSYLLFTEWQKDYGPKQITPEPQQTQLTIPNGDAIPGSDIPTSEIKSTSSAIGNEQQLISVKTKVLSIQIDTRGGDIVAGDLLQYPIIQGESELVHLLSQNNKAQSDLLGLPGTDGKPLKRLNYTANKVEYEAIGSENLVIPLTWSNNRGINVTKTFTIKPDEYDIEVKYTITNNTNSIRPVQQFGQLKKVIVPSESSMMMNAYHEATYSTAEERYEKYKLSDMKEQKLLKTTEGGWVAMQEHYFVSAWVPQQTQTNKLFSAVAPDGSAIIGYRGPVINIEPGQTQTLTSTLYVGPKIQKKLGQLAQTLELTVDYGPLWFISQFLFSLLTFLQSLVHNWGVSIILITVIVKTFLYPLTKKQTISMAKMRNIAPKMQALKEKFGDDKAKMGPAMMELYKKEQVNPMGGCLPLLLQMPIFLSLYWMLMESVELRHAGFILWITDLSTKDPYYVLPVLYGASMFIMQKITPTPATDPMQQKMMTWMPVVFSVLFVIFPAGLVLYWLVNNLITITQTLYIYRQIDKKGLATSPAIAKTTK